MIRIIGNDIWMRQGDTGKVDFDGFPTDYNYRVYLALKNIDTKNIEIAISDVLAASIFKPCDEEDNYICLIMPVKVQ